MTNIEHFASLLESKIVQLNKNILEYELYSSELLTNIISQLDNKDICNLNEEEAAYLKKNFYKTSILSEEEYRFLREFSQIPTKIKAVLKKIGLSREQENLIFTIKEKLGALRDSSSQMNLEKLEIELQKYKNLLFKFTGNNQLELISEIELIEEILSDANVPLEQQAALFLDINLRNLRVFQNYDSHGFNSDDSYDDVGEDVILSFEDLAITNMQQDVMINLFGQFGLVWDDFDKYKIRLLKYGDYDRILEMLTYIKNTPLLNYLFEKPEPLVKILLFSKFDDVKNVVKSAQENNISGILQTYPSVLIPPIREHKGKKKGGPSTLESTISGSMINYMRLVEEFKRRGFSISKIYKDCSFIFTKNYKTVMRSLEYLDLYNISFLNSNGDTENGFSCLICGDISLNIDSAIENGFFEYCQENRSRLNGTINFYRARYAQKLFKEGQPEGFMYPFSQFKNGSTRLALRNEIYSNAVSTYGKNKEDTFKLYGAINFESEYKELYDTILDNYYSTRISELVKSDSVVEQLDSLYMNPEHPYKYDMNGITISRYKVLRYYETLLSKSEVEVSKDLFMYLCTVNSMLDKEEMNTLEQCLGMIKFKRR